MPKSETQHQPPPAGYPTGNPPTGNKGSTRTKKKGDRGFIEGCIFALCCCWLCEECF
ncbi:cysteine-rich and transmembrane domain-containing protein A [Fagus crenata]